MTTKFGWCFGPEGAATDHTSCPHEIGAGDTILRCGCPCHEHKANQQRRNYGPLYTIGGE